MLIRQLRELEDDEIINRVVYPVVPLKVEYQLGEIGRPRKAGIKAFRAF